MPPQLDAAVFIAIHSAQYFSSSLPELLTNRGPLPARHPLHGDKIVPGHIYIAPPDMQLYVRQGAMDIVRGPKENGHRPSVDAMFRSASLAHGPQVVGVVLSGHQDCGTAGMMSIKARGGVSIVQDPMSALAPDMPRSVLQHVKVDHIVQPSELPKLLTRLVEESLDQSSEVIKMQPDAHNRQMEGMELGAPADLSCPICQGVLTETVASSFKHFRCHVGHAFSLQSLLAEQNEELERALWAAVRALEESAALNNRLQWNEQGKLMKERFNEKAMTQLAQANLIREILLYGSPLSPKEPCT